MKAYRFLYQPVAHDPAGGWMGHLSMTAAMPKHRADALVREWDKKDTGRYRWKHAESLPGDIDYPAIAAEG